MHRNFDPNEVILLVSEIFGSEVKSKNLEIEVKLRGSKKTGTQQTERSNNRRLQAGKFSDEVKSTAEKNTAQVDLPILNGDMRRF